MCIERGFAIIIGILLIILVEIFRGIKSKISNRVFWNYKECLFILLGVYIVALISITQFPLRVGTELEPIANIVPVFNTIKDINSIRPDMQNFMIRFWIVNIVGNLLLLAPLALIMPLLFKKFRNIKSTVLLCFLVSAIIELLQYVSMYLGNNRSVDIDDVILNTLGAIMGFSIFKLIDKRILKSDRITSKCEN